jgi:hypothetical protein
MGAMATRTGVSAPARGLDWPRSTLAALAALATAWTLSLLVAGAVLLVSGHRHFDFGDRSALPALIGFAATYCAALAVLVRSHGGLHPLAAGAVGIVVVIVCLPGPNPVAAAAGLIAVAAIVEWGSHPPVPAGMGVPASLGLGVAGALVLAAGLAGIAESNQRGSPLPATRPLAEAPPRAVPTSTPTPAAITPAPTPTRPAPVPATPPVAESPTAVVRAYYRALDQHDFAAAWARLSPAVRSTFGGYTAWRAGYASTLSSRPSEITVVAAGPDTVTLRHRLDAVDGGPAGRRSASFVVAWRLTRTDAGWVATSLTARAG